MHTQPQMLDFMVKCIILKNEYKETFDMAIREYVEWSETVKSGGWQTGNPQGNDTKLIAYNY